MPARVFGSSRPLEGQSRPAAVCLLVHRRRLLAEVCNTLQCTVVICGQVWVDSLPTAYTRAEERAEGTGFKASRRTAVAENLAWLSDSELQRIGIAVDTIAKIVRERRYHRPVASQCPNVMFWDISLA